MYFTHDGWEKKLLEHNISWRDIRSIYITHYHPDHYGAAGWLQKKTGAPIFMSERELTNVKNVWLAGFDFMDEFNRFYISNGVPEDLLKNISGSMIKTARSIFPEPPEIDIIKEGDIVMLGDLSYEAIITPGHSDGHVCFFNSENRILISGDHLLPKITSNIGIWPGSDKNPLKCFFNSLNRVDKLNASYAIPAHGEIFQKVSKRIEELIEHHRKRLQLMAEIASDGKSAFEISQKIFGKELTLHEIRFAISETIAHMVYLKEEEKVSSSVHNDVIIYKYNV